MTEKSTQPWYKTLYVQVLLGIVLGVLCGEFYDPYFKGLWPAFPTDAKFLSDLFIALLKMLLSGIIFCTVVHGIAGGDKEHKIGKTGAKAMLYFMSVTFFSLVLGMVVAHLVQPGVGFNVDPATLKNTKELEMYAQKGAGLDYSLTGMILHVIPKTLFSAFAEGEILQILFISVFFAVTLRKLGDVATPVVNLIEVISSTVMTMVKSIMVLAPLAAFGAMSFTVGKYGTSSLMPMMKLVATFYITGFVFVAVVLGLVCRLYLGVSIFKVLKYLKQELLIILGTSSSETVLPQLLVKMENAGCAPAVVRIVVPTGYSFNLDGTSIAMTLTLMFVAQALNIQLTWEQEIELLLLCMLTSKGAAGVVGSGMIVMASTLSIMKVIPVAGLTLVLGIDRFMSECRALVNYTGNAVATLVIAKWEGKLDEERLKFVLDNPDVFSQSQGRKGIDDGWG